METLSRMSRRIAVWVPLLSLALCVISVAEAKRKKPTYLIKFRSGINLAQSARMMSSNGLRLKSHIDGVDIYLAEISNLRKFAKKGFQAVAQSPEVEYIEENVQVHAFRIPNDPLFNEQNGYVRMEMEKAWHLSTGSSDVLIAVSDTGTQFSHPDLVNQIWKNPGEIAGNNKDDDNNGYVDDITGWDFANKDANADDDNDVGHGTHVAGIIGAEGNNDKGIAGVMWDASIMTVKFLDAKGSGSLAAGVGTIVYAADNGARIINASWGSSASSNAIKDAIAYANSKGALFIAAAGNGDSSGRGFNIDKRGSFPAGHQLPGIISVASSVNLGKFSGFSNYGPVSVDLAAPGSGILSTANDGKVVKDRFDGKDYIKLNGTSMATPMVSGVAGLILSEKPGLSMIELRNAVLNAVRPQPGYQGKLSTAGELSAYRALAQLTDGFQVWPSRMTVNKGASFQFTAYDASGSVNWSVNDETLATIDQNGVLTALAKGKVVVTATDANGSISTEDIHLVNVQLGGGDGGSVGGCASSVKRNMKGKDRANALLNLGLPFMVGFMFKIRRRKKRAQAKKVC